MNSADLLPSYLDEQFQAARQVGWVLHYQYPAGEFGLDIQATHGSHAVQTFSTKDAPEITSAAEFEQWVQRCAGALYALTPIHLPDVTPIGGIVDEAGL